MFSSGERGNHNQHCQTTCSGYVHVTGNNLPDVRVASPSSYEWCHDVSIFRSSDSNHD